jgi:hypothetical protein
MYQAQLLFHKLFRLVTKSHYLGATMDKESGEIVIRVSIPSLKLVPEPLSDLVYSIPAIQILAELDKNFIDMLLGICVLQRPRLWSANLEVKVG